TKPRRRQLMQYVLLVYDDGTQWENIPEAEYQKIYAEYAAVSALPATQSGKQLQPVDTARSVRIKDGQRIVTDGPFAETKEVISGFYLIDAETEERALELAAQIPTVSRMGGVIEVRPIVER